MSDETNHAVPLGRRQMLAGLGLASALVGVAADETARAGPIAPADGTIRLGGRTVRFADLSHRLTRAFNLDPNRPRIAFEPIDGSGKAVGMRLNRVLLNEHTGTHLDAPSHFAPDGKTLGEIPLADLVVPLVVLDMRDRLAADANAKVEPIDVDRWEHRHGRLPSGCCVAMWTGFDPLAPLRPAGAGRRMSMPGFAPVVIERLVQRSVKGVAVDSMTIDSGDNTPSYPFHQAWLRSGHWGIEGLTNLATVPANGAVLVVGAPPIAEATGMPIRAIALF